MSTPPKYPKRLIEVDLPIRRISEYARGEKSIKDGHISTLHIWWARRPLAACRAVILAATWPDPVDPLCPARFREAAARILTDLRGRRGGRPRDFSDPGELRAALLDLIVDISDWNRSNDPVLLDACRSLITSCQEVSGGTSVRPVLADPFAGGGAIPFEALRLGFTPFASDLNPIPVLLNKTLLEFLPKYGGRLIESVGDSGRAIRRRLEERLREFYLGKGSSGTTTPFAYFWGRTIVCEGPACGFRFPLIRSLWLKQDARAGVALELVPERKSRSFKTRVAATPASKNNIPGGTTRHGAATCPECGFTTPVERVRSQLKARGGGTVDAQLLAVCEVRAGHVGKLYREPRTEDLRAFEGAHAQFETVRDQRDEWGRRLPDESLNHLRGFFNVVLYGMSRWGDLLAPRQALLMMELTLEIRQEYQRISKEDPDFASAVSTVLALAAGKAVQYNSSCCRWKAKGETLVDMFGRQAIPMVWDFAEAYPFGNTTGDFGKYVENACDVLRRSTVGSITGTVVRSSATEHVLPDDSVDAFITDPPYYDAIPYADLSDFFYVWLRRSLGASMPDLFQEPLTPKDQECVVLAHRAAMYRNKDRVFFETMMAKAMAEGRRITKPSGIGVVVFANKSTAGWEAMLAALIEGGWVITGSWPIDTEMGSRLRAQNSATLASSVHIVCRPREGLDGSVRTDDVADWRDVLGELPKRMHEWMPRLASEGVVGADAIFACLGPALEIFSRHSRVEKPSGERVSLKEYLEHVWAAVSKEALARIFEGADATDFEEDARLTAIWLWTLSTGTNGDRGSGTEGPGEDEEEEESGGKGKIAGFVLEYDAARKIAQGLGAHLEVLSSAVEIKGDTARLLSVAERTRALFSKDQAEAVRARPRKKEAQLKLGFIGELEEAEEIGGWGPKGAPAKGATMLDRVHQAMILFAAGRGEALRRFLVDDGVGHDARFWKLADNLSKLYPVITDEKRWVDGVLARKKGFGF